MLTDLALPDLSLTMAHLAADAYLDDCSGTFRSLGFTNYMHINKENANGHLAANNTEVVISFRGTVPSHISDLTADANALPIREDRGFVHDGFRTYTRYLLPQVMDWVAANPGKDIYIVGHSLGAAMSLYCVRELEDAGYTVKKLFTFGQPRLGNKEFVGAVKADHHRFVNCNDIIPTVPPAELGYHHQGTLCYINFYGNIRPLTNWQIIKDKWRGHLAAWKKGQFLDSLEDHFMENYIAKLENIQKTNQSIN